MHFGPLGCLTKLGAKGAKVVQKFVPRSRIRIFGNERTRSTPLDPKLMFWCDSYRLRVFGTVKLPYETQGKTFRTSPKVRATKSHRNFSQCTHPIDPIGPLNSCFVAFRTIWDRLVALQNWCKTGRTSAKVRATKSHRNFLQ